MRTTSLRGAAAVTGAALVLGLGLSVPSAQAAPIPGPSGADPAPAAAAAAYLAAQPNGGNILETVYGPGPTDKYDDYGLTIDAGYALDAAGGQTAKLTAMTNALVSNADNYYNAFSGTGAAAKLSAYLQSQGRTGTLVDDLVGAVEDHIATSGDTQGRLEDPDDPGTMYDDDFNSPLTQAFAVASLHDAGSSLAGSTLDFLLDQQCAAGFFRASFSAKADTDQTCDGATSPTPSVDTTALSVLMLQDQKSAPAVSAALTEALDWLVSQQGANGSFSAGNANATGLAGWALGVSGRTAAAGKAALWLRGQQLANAGSCTKYAAADAGGVALDSLGLANAATGPLSPVDKSVVTRATTQALPALLWAPGGAAAGGTTLTGPGDFVKAGTAQTVTLAGAPGNTLCVTVGGTASRVVLDANGAATVPVTMPATTADVTVSSVDAGGEADSLTITGLAKARFKAKGPAKVELGSRFTIRFSGLEPGEHAVVKYAGKKLKKVANAKGVVKVRLKATKLGKRKVTIKGELGARVGAKAVMVVR